MLLPLQLVMLLLLLQLLVQLLVLTWVMMLLLLVRSLELMLQQVLLHQTFWTCKKSCQKDKVRCQSEVENPP